MGVHHYASIGSYSFVGGLSRVLHDVPPFMLVEGHPARPRCINVVALKRNDFSTAVIHCLAEAHRLLYRAKVGLDHAREILRGNDQLVPASQRAVGLHRATARRQTRPGPRTEESRVSKLRLAVVGRRPPGTNPRPAAGRAGRRRCWSAWPIADAANRAEVAAACQTTAVADYHELVDEVDAAIIATPTYTHRDVALEFLNRGLHVLVEKPLASSVREADDLVAAGPPPQGACCKSGTSNDSIRRWSRPSRIWSAAVHRGRRGSARSPPARPTSASCST